MKRFILKPYRFLFAALLLPGTVHGKNGNQSIAIQINPPAAPSVISVVVSPPTVGLLPNQAQQFFAVVSGTTNLAVIWSIIPASGSISTSGIYHSPGALVSTQNVIVRAASVVDPTKFDSAIVTLIPSPSTNPSAPTGLQAVPSDSQATLSWNAVSGATGYRLYGSSTTGVTPNSASLVLNTTQSSQLVPALINSVTYYFVVTAVNASGESVPSAQAAVQPVSAEEIGLPIIAPPLPIPVPASGVPLSGFHFGINGTKAWSVEGSPFVTFLSTTSGVYTAAGEVDFSIGANASPTPRSGSITLSLSGKVAYIVNFTQAGATTLSVSPSSVTLSYTIGGPFPNGQLVSFESTNPSSGVPLSSISLAGSCSWLGASPTGSVTPFQYAIGADPTGLTAGSYPCTFTVNAGGTSADVHALLNVLPSTSTTLSVSPSSVTFSYRIGDSLPVAGNHFTITSSPTSGASITFSSATGSCLWLSTSLSGANTPLTVSLVPGPIGLSTGSYVCTLSYSAPGIPLLSVPVEFDILPVLPLVITSTGLPTAILGQSYSAQLTATGGIAPLGWACCGAFPVPPGLTISAAGILSGTPTTAGTFPITVAVLDAGFEQITQKSLTLSVVSSAPPAAPPTPIIQGFDPSPGTVDRNTTLRLNIVGVWTQIDWTFSSRSEGSALGWPAQTGTITATGASYTATTQAASLGLGPLPIADGPQHLIVVVYNGASSASMSADFTLVSSNLSAVRVFPSPWRSDLHAGQDLTFDNLPAGSTIKIFTTSGRWVKTLSNVSGQAPWDLKNDNGNMVASGLYLYLVTDAQGEKAHGKFGVIR